MTTYKESGVDIEKAEKLVNFLNISGFGSSIDLGDGRKLTLSTDGVGTKILIAEELQIYDTIGIDLVAMCVNDILCMGAKPIAFLDYYAMGKLDLEKSKKILAGILKGCELAGCPLVGGETAEMPGVYPENGFDLAGFSAGIVEKGNTKPSIDIKEGDLIIGIPSSGFHSNGFSLIRTIYKNHGITPELNDLTPTKIYVNDIIPNMHLIKALAHITGGGIHGNLPRALPDRLTYDIKIPYSDKFNWLFRLSGLTNIEFENVFNCGWGMILIAESDELIDCVKNSVVLGRVIEK
jgi:phosphoribosylformylglycinamidine cyclo-ligase